MSSTSGQSSRMGWIARITFWLLLLITANAAPDIVFPGAERTTTACTLPNGGEGNCVLAIDCPEAFTSRGQTPKICGFVGRQSIICCPQKKDPPTSAEDVSPPKLPFECGLVNYNRGSSGGRRGRRLVKHNLPWVSLIGEEDKTTGMITWFCGGTLINTQWILTAAHCVNQNNATVVRLGAVDIASHSNYQNMEVAQVIIHPGYKLPASYQDLALVRLKTPVKFRNTIGPVCLPWGTGERGRNLVGERLTIAGWGAQYFRGELSSILLEAVLSVFESNICDQSYSKLIDYKNRYPGGIGRETLCVGDPTDRGRDACEGDSGGGAVREGYNGYVIEGVISTGFGCGKANFPGLYVRVTDPINLSWIKMIAFSEYPSLPDILNIKDKPNNGNSGILVPSLPTPLNERLGCGKLRYESSGENRNNRVRRVTRNHWPWLVLLGYKNTKNLTAEHRFLCAGALINDQWVLTAAHCFRTSGNYVLSFVRLGENDLDSETDGRHEDVGIEGTFSHHKFDIQDLTYDFGLIKMNKKVFFRGMISPVCLPLNTDNTRVRPGDRVIAAGFGRTSFGGETSGIVLDAELVVKDLDVCRQRFNSLGASRPLSNDMLCIGDPTGRDQDTCQGDSGAPVVREVGGSYVAEGLVSFGIRCGLKDTPAIYARVDKALQWIMQVAFSDESSN